MNSLIPSGWYPDPSGLDYDRFWDGANWTNQTRPKDVFSQNVFAPQPKSEVSKSKPPLLKIGVGVGVGAAIIVLIAGIVFFATLDRSDSRLTDAVAACGVAGSSGIIFAEDGQSLFFDGKGEDDYIGGDYNDVKCILDALEAPSTVWEQVLSTTALMGQQQQDLDGIKVSWSYHPDSGLNTNFNILE